MNFCDMEKILRGEVPELEFSNSPQRLSGRHEKDNVSDLQPLSQDDMKRYAAPDFSEFMQQHINELPTMKISNLDGHGGHNQKITQLTQGIRQ